MRASPMLLLLAGSALLSASCDADPPCSDAGSCAAAGACGVCRDEKCRDVLPYCVDEPDCACMSDCLAASGIPGVADCLEGCGLSERPPAFAALEECVAVACPDAEDECSTPADYQFPDGSVLVTTNDIGDGTLADCGFDAALPFDPTGAVLQLQSTDGTVCARVVRQDLGPGDQANTAWALVALTVGPLGLVRVVDESTALCWYSSHHNFADRAHAWSGTRHWDLKLEESGHGGTRSYELSTFAQGPVDPDNCAPIADGTEPIGQTLKLFPYDP